MKIKIFGTRGSIATNITESELGSNTTCIGVLLDPQNLVILDAGTGIASIEPWLKKMGLDPQITLLLTHTHWDHIQGLTNFSPIFNKNKPLDIISLKDDLKATMQTLFDGVHFPVAWSSVERENMRLIKASGNFELAGAKISFCPTTHPNGCVAWKIEKNGVGFVFTGDHEFYQDTKNDSNLVNFIKGADFLLADASYLESEFSNFKGWGHSTMSQWASALSQISPQTTLLFTHHMAHNADINIYAELERTKGKFGAQKMALAFEGMEITNSAISVSETHKCELCDFSASIASLPDTHSILEQILTKAREIAHADAGTIYLIDDDMLDFAYTQNQTLFPGNAASKYNYISAKMPISLNSIAGFVASKGETLNLPDVYELPADLPFKFNDSFDKKSGYRTRSMLCVPIISNAKIVGVMQLINCVIESEQMSFLPHLQAKIEHLAMLSGNSIERAQMTREMLMRMLKTSALRDPLETASHVERVGAVCAEIYKRWAQEHGVEPENATRTQANLRLAAMMHDVGKVAIPDAVLKKPDKLTDEEFAVIKSHCALGAGLFSQNSSELDNMARNVALYHHQKWDGTGYTGSADFPNLSGEQIPLEARITTVADVYDALVSPRCYKPGWESERAYGVLQKDAGTHFDPDIVEIFTNMKDVVAAIYAKYPFEVPEI